MQQSSEYYLVITALGTDRPGIVNAITHHVSSCGCNIEDSRLAMLGESFTFIMLLSGSWNAITQIESTLPHKGAELDLLIVMKRTRASAKPSMPTTLKIQVEVDDSPRIIERFTNLFNTQQDHIAELVSKTRQGKSVDSVKLHIEMTVHIASSDNVQLIENNFHQLCAKLTAQGTITVITNANAVIN